MSRIGRMPIVVPKEVKVSFDPSKVEVTGPKGHLSMICLRGFRSPWTEERSRFTVAR